MKPGCSNVYYQLLLRRTLVLSYRYAAVRSALLIRITIMMK